MPKALLLGCGRDRRRKVRLPNQTESFDDALLVALDMDPAVADVVWNLDVRPLPFADEEFDELHAYDVLEHVGRQGDWRGYFDEFSEYWRILKPRGTFHVIVPIGADHFADPGHTRFFSANHFWFLTLQFHEHNVIEQRPMTDYRWYVKHWWEIAFMQYDGDHHLCVLLRKVV